MPFCFRVGGPFRSNRPPRRWSHYAYDMSAQLSQTPAVDASSSREGRVAGATTTAEGWRGRT